MYVIIGRKPHEENEVYTSLKRSWKAAKREFATWLWEDSEPGDRKSCRESNGDDHYLEAAIRVDGTFKVMYHPSYGELTEKKRGSTH
jgi:hypothetical protein